jgi:hypothetical protein
MPFDSQTGRCARSRRGGLKRAAYWHTLGFPNLVRARAAKALYRLEREKHAELALPQATTSMLRVNPPR